MRIDLLIIDPQRDFIDTPGSPGSLAVAGAYQDMRRLATFIKRAGQKLNDIHVTMDSHSTIDVSHAAFWRNANNGSHPTPFTFIKEGDVGTLWVPTEASKMARMKDYVSALAKRGRQALCIWPDHCLKGSVGHTIDEAVFNELLEWERRNIAIVDTVTKGSNPYTEHYSAVEAEVPDPMDPSTQLNMQLINMLQNRDQVVIAGEALSHCVANTVRDIVNTFSSEDVKKIVLLRDCTSNVGDPPGTTLFTDMGNNFLKEMQAKGMQVVDSTAYLV